MAWAFRYSRRKLNIEKMALLEREQVPIMLQILKEYEVPITWATVGHLFLESCQKGDHDWMRRIPYFDAKWKFSQGDWFEHDPYTNVQADPAWYAPDLVEAILASNTGHEIACHTFSHIDCTDEVCPAGVFEDELDACIQAAKKWDLRLTSFVFPGGTYGNFETLAKKGFKIIRRKTKYDLDYPQRDAHNIINTPSSLSFGKPYSWSADYYIWRFKVILDKAVKHNTLAHFWLHPSVDRWTLDHVFPEVMKYASSLREKGELWIGTLKDFAKHYESREN